MAAHHRFQKGSRGLHRYCNSDYHDLEGRLAFLMDHQASAAVDMSNWGAYDALDGVEAFALSENILLDVESQALIKGLVGNELGYAGNLFTPLDDQKPGGALLMQWASSDAANGRPKQRAKRDEAARSRRKAEKKRSEMKAAEEVICNHWEGPVLRDVPRNIGAAGLRLVAPAVAPLLSLRLRALHTQTKNACRQWRVCLLSTRP